MKLLVDMNLSPQWIELLSVAGHDAVHWSSLGSPSAPDQELFAWATLNGCVVLTHDLDFGAILAATKTVAPSVLQLRMQDVTPEGAGPLVLAALRTYENYLLAGALVTLDTTRQRVRILPMHPD